MTESLDLLTRRTFMIGTAAFAGGFVVACKTGGNRSEVKGVGETLQAIAAIKFPNAWVAVTKDGQILYTLDRVEMGQGTMTSHASIVAEELGIEPNKVIVQFAPPAKIYFNPGYGIQATGGTTSLSGSWQPLRLAAAATREMLTAGGAQKMGVNVKECVCEKGKIVHKPTGKDVKFADIAQYTAENIKAPSAPLPKPMSSYKTLGKSVKRLDSPEKVVGKAVYGIDVKVEGMMIACVARPGAHGAKITSFDDAKAKEYMQANGGGGEIVQIASGIACITKHFWTSKKAADLVTVQASGGIDPSFDGNLSKLVEAKGLATAPAVSVTKKGDAVAALSTGTKVEAQYEVPYAPHQTLEPQNCTAHYDGTKLTIWCPTQVPDGVQGIGARITGLSESNVIVNQTYLGGGFGRRLSLDFVAEAVEISFKVKKPVKLIWTREDDIRHDVYRPGMVHVMKGSVEGGKIASWNQRIVGQSLGVAVSKDSLTTVLPAMISADKINFLGRIVQLTASKQVIVDPFSVEGATESMYAMATQNVDYHYVETGVPIGWWRSVGHFHTGFAGECFVNELAVAANKDPLAFRESLCGGNDRMIGVLRKVREMSAWADAGTGPDEAKRAKGVASHACFGSFCAIVTQIALVGGKLRVEKVWAAIDVGFAVNPDIVRQQVEGSVIFGLTSALKQKITFKDGATVEGNFNNSDLLRLNYTPDIIVELVNDKAQGIPPTGIGEVAVPSIAPSLINAISRAGGEKIRSLPIAMALTPMIHVAGAGTNPGNGTDTGPGTGTDPGPGTGTGSGTGTGTGTGDTPVGNPVADAAWKSVEQNCKTSGCHSNYKDLKWMVEKKKVKPGSVEESKIIIRIKDDADMPQNEDGEPIPMPAAALKAIEDWITAGAPTPG